MWVSRKPGKKNDIFLDELGAGGKCRISAGSHEWLFKVPERVSTGVMNAILPCSSTPMLVFVRISVLLRSVQWMKVPV